MLLEFPALQIPSLFLLLSPRHVFAPQYNQYLGLTWCLSFHKTPSWYITYLSNPPPLFSAHPGFAEASALCLITSCVLD